ncbi:MAG: helical membrane plugin domain-containing protein [Acidobacteriaceae bacterium]
MAQPLSFDYAKQDKHARLREDLGNAPLEHAEAILAALKLLQQAQDHGVLDGLRGAIEGGETVVDKLAAYANTPESIRAIRNLIALSLLLGQLDPEVLGSIVKGAQSSVAESNPDMQNPPGFFAILRRLFSVDARRGMVAGVSVLSAVGRSLRPKPGEAIIRK